MEAAVVFTKQKKGLYPAYVLELPIPYFELQMPMPFAHLPEITTRAPVGTAELDTSRAGHYFWGNQCVIPIE